MSSAMTTSQVEHNCSLRVSKIYKKTAETQPHARVGAGEAHQAPGNNAAIPGLLSWTGAWETIEEVLCDS
jgi:hypothetical protein